MSEWNHLLRLLNIMNFLDVFLQSSSLKQKAKCHVKKRARRYWFTDGKAETYDFVEGQTETYGFGVAQPLESRKNSP